jgi:hypothetical protein
MQTATVTWATQPLHAGTYKPRVSWHYYRMSPTPTMAISVSQLELGNLIFSCENAWSSLQIDWTTLRAHGDLARGGLGHSRIAMTLDIYSHVSLDLEKQAAVKLNTVLMSGLQ